MHPLPNLWPHAFLTAAGNSKKAAKKAAAEKMVSKLLSLSGCSEITWVGLNTAHSSSDQRRQLQHLPARPFFQLSVSTYSFCLTFHYADAQTERPIREPKELDGGDHLSTEKKPAEHPQHGLHSEDVGAVQGAGL